LRDHQAALEAVRRAERELEQAKATSGAKSDEVKAKEQALKEARKALSEAEKELKGVTSDLENGNENVKSGIAGFFTGLFGGGWGGNTAGGAAAGHVPPEATAAMARAGVPGLQSGGIVTAPTLAFLGEAGPEAVIPLERLPNMTIQFNAPLVNIEGSADKRTAEYAANLVVEKLKTVLIEPTSQSAPTKRIYIPGGGF